MTDLERYGPWAVIVGASEGIGEHAARQLAADGFSIVLVSRRQAVLDDLRDSILASSPDVEIRCLAIDLVAGDAASDLLAAISDIDTGLLVYNAGADTGPVRFDERTREDVLGMVQRNVVVPTEMCHALGRDMRAREAGVASS